MSFCLFLLRLHANTYIIARTSVSSPYEFSEPYYKIEQKSITGFLYNGMLFVDNKSMLPLIEMPFIVLSHQTIFPLIASFNITYIFGQNAMNSYTYQEGFTDSTSAYSSFNSPNISDVGSLTCEGFLLST